MCMVDYADERPSVSHVYVVNRARKLAQCCECGRDIAVGESYRRCEMVYEGSWYTFRMCAQCQVAAGWLREECGGYLWEGVLEDLEQHVAERNHGIGIAKLAAGMRRKWKRFDGTGLMALPKMPPTTHANG